MSRPDQNGFFGQFGGKFVPDTLFSELENIEKSFKASQQSPSFKKNLQAILKDFVGRPTPLLKADQLSKEIGAEIYLKREDLCHTGAHKINNAIAQALLAKQMGKTRVIAETGAGQHGVATATACALLKIDCCIYMGSEDIHRQALNVKRMELLGATVVSVEIGTKTLKEATTQAIRDWMGSVKNTHYSIGSALGPHPYPWMVRTFQSIIGQEAKKQLKKQTGKGPDIVLACVGGGSNALGIFTPFLNENVKLIAVEAAGEGLETQKHAASLSKGTKGVLHGSLNQLLQTKQGQISAPHSISAGLDYPGVGPELCDLFYKKHIQVASITDQEALAACQWLAKSEGIIPALETAHAIAYLKKIKSKKGQVIVVNVSGRGDKDMEIIAKYVD